MNYRRDRQHPRRGVAYTSFRRHPSLAICSPASAHRHGARVHDSMKQHFVWSYDILAPDQTVLGSSVNNGHVSR